MRTLKELYRANSFVELICRYIEINYGIKVTETNSPCLLKILYGVFSRYPDTEEDLDFFVRFHLRDCIWNNESYFFRNYTQLEFLRKIHKKDFLNILSFGCAEGQEPYSISIVLTENEIKHKIYGIDIDEIAISKAKSGVYTAFDMRNFDEKYTWAFDVDDEYIYIKEELKDNVQFIHANCLRVPLEEHLPEKVDLIFCNNVLIYLTESYIKNLVKQFCSVLNYDGYIFTTYEEDKYFIDNSYLVKVSSDPVVFQKRHINQIIEKDFRELYSMGGEDSLSTDKYLSELEDKLKEDFNIETLRRLVTLNILKNRLEDAKRWQYLILLAGGYSEEDLDLYLQICLKNGDDEELIDMLKKKVEIFKKEEDILLLIEISKKIGNANLYFNYKSYYETLFNKKII
jgi:chemotaxis protein methyltransferase CheR